MFEETSETNQRPVKVNVKRYFTASHINWNDFKGLFASRFDIGFVYVASSPKTFVQTDLFFLLSQHVAFSHCPVASEESLSYLAAGRSDPFKSFAYQATRFEGEESDE